MGTKLGIRAVDIMFGTEILGRVVWVYGEASATNTIESWRVPELDCDSALGIATMIHCIRKGDPSGDFEFLWDNYFDASDRAS